MDSGWAINFATSTIKKLFPPRGKSFLIQHPGLLQSLEIYPQALYNPAMNIFRFYWVCLLICFFAGCSAPTPFPTATPVPTKTALPTQPLATATLTQTPLPTPTQTPPATPTPVIVVERGQLPPGFSLTIYTDVPYPTNLTFGPDGRLYVASIDQNIYVFSDAGHGRARSDGIFASGLATPLGLLWVEDRLYVSTTGSLVALADTNQDGRQDQTTVILDGLPNGLHQNDGLVMGKDGYIYLGLGSTCDACLESDPRSASILRFKPDGSDLTVYAKGFRNPFDLAFNAAGDLFATDNGRDKLGDDLPQEELNLVRAGQDYGWPDCWLGNTEPACAEKTQPIAGFTAHSSVDGLLFYDGENFPAIYRDQAFVAVFGSYLLPKIERGIQRVVLTPNGDSYTTQAEWFLQLGTEGHPLDITVGPDGAIYVADYEKNAVYRIVYGAP